MSEKDDTKNVAHGLFSEQQNNTTNDVLVSNKKEEANTSTKSGSRTYDDELEELVAAYQRDFIETIPIGCEFQLCRAVAGTDACPDGSDKEKKRRGVSSSSSRWTTVTRRTVNCYALSSKFEIRETTASELSNRSKWKIRVPECEKRRMKESIIQRNNGKRRRDKNECIKEAKRIARERFDKEVVKSAYEDFQKDRNLCTNTDEETKTFQSYLYNLTNKEQHYIFPMYDEFDDAIEYVMEVYTTLAGEDVIVHPPTKDMMLKLRQQEDRCKDEHQRKNKSPMKRRNVYETQQQPYRV